MAATKENSEQVMKILCETLEGIDINYEKNEEKMAVEIKVMGDDLPMIGTFLIKESNQLIVFISQMPFKISEAKRIDAVLAVNVLNNMLADGCFDIDISTGAILFRMTASYRESYITNELFEYMIAIGFRTIDDYNDKFLMLDKDIVNLEQFIDSVC